MTAAQRAESLFRDGYNCCQAVAGAFAEQGSAEFEAVMRMTSTMGGGVAGMRGVCGAVSGMCLAYGLACGKIEPMRGEEKAANYAGAKALADEFLARFGSLQCKTLLENAGLPAAADANRPPEPRSPDYYAKRPCPSLVACAAELLEQRLRDGV